jgi:hypothetical protein
MLHSKSHSALCKYNESKITEIQHYYRHLSTMKSNIIYIKFLKAFSVRFRISLPGVRNYLFEQELDKQ